MRQTAKQALHSTSGTILDVVKVSDLKEIRDQDTVDSNIVEYWEVLVCCILNIYIPKTIY